MKLIIGLFVLLFVIGLGFKLSQDYLKDNQLPFGKTPTATIQKQTFRLMVAKTAKEKEIGLSEKKSLPQNQGMLFLFEMDDYYSFWMKNMKFPLDIIYMNNNKIVTIHQSVLPPRSELESIPIYKPDSPSDAVLEINAGLSKKYNFKKGDQVKLKDVESPK